MADLRIESRNVRWDPPPPAPPPGNRPLQSESYEIRPGADLLFDRRRGYAGGQFQIDRGLRTAVFLSLFTDRRALDSDELPESTDAAFPYRGGYWADFLSPLGPDDRFGSRLWLLKSQTIDDTTVARARSYALESLEWIRSEGIGTVEVQVTRPRPDAIAIEVTISDTLDREETRFQFVWDAMQREGV